MPFCLKNRQLQAGRMANARAGTWVTYASFFQGMAVPLAGKTVGYVLARVSSLCTRERILLSRLCQRSL